MSEHSPRLKMKSYERFDGSPWRQYETDDAIITLTGVGRDLAAKGGLAKILRAYKRDAEGGTDQTRKFLAQGGNGQVFRMGESGLVVKEARLGTADQLRPAIDRIDALKSAVETHAPHWINVPKHYGTMISKVDAKQYLLMEQIDHGVSVGDILKYPNEGDGREGMAAAVRENFGPVTDKVAEDVARRYETIKGTLRQALIAEYLSPDVYLPDLDTNPHNVLVEPLPAPIGGSPNRYWIIDQ